MSMLDWARQEVEIACKRENPDFKLGTGEFDYGCSCYESALKAYESLLEDGHSGYSFAITRSILIRLMNGIPLTPIEDIPDVWNKVSERNYGSNKHIDEYQCKRMSSLFKEVHNGSLVKYLDIDYITTIDTMTDTAWHSGFISNMFYEMYPIEMPYMPSVDPIKVYVEMFLYDKECGGDYDTLGILYYTKDGEKHDFEKYYKEDNNEPTGWKLVTTSEYLERKAKRVIKEDKS